jgi:hypothetical protein
MLDLKKVLPMFISEIFIKKGLKLKKIHLMQIKSRY